MRDKGSVTAQDNTVSCNNFGFIIARHASGMREANRILANSITVTPPPPPRHARLLSACRHRVRLTSPPHSGAGAAE